MSGNAAVEPKKKLKFLIAHEWEVGVLFIILVVCMVVFEKAMHLIEHRIAHSAVPQRGLKRALKKMKDELLVTGFLSLLLAALQVRTLHSSSSMPPQLHEIVQPDRTCICTASARQD